MSRKLFYCRVSKFLSWNAKEAAIESPFSNTEPECFHEAPITLFAKIELRVGSVHTDFPSGPSGQVTLV